MDEIKIEKAQALLNEFQIEGWLLYDFKGSNPLARTFLEMEKKVHVTRRFFYWIPREGQPIKIVHAVDKSALEFLYGNDLVFKSMDELQLHLSKLVSNKTIAMEYSPLGVLPSVSYVAGCTLELIKSFDVKVVSSANILQHFTAKLSIKQLQSHLKAAEFLQYAVEKVKTLIAENVDGSLTDYEIASYLLSLFKKHGFVTEHLPIIAIGEDSAIPHFAPSALNPRLIKNKDLILIDIFAKLDEKDAIYADICRMALIGREPTVEENLVFNVVLEAQIRALDFLSTHKNVMGCQVDEVARKVITKAGFGEYFTHRTGHNIFEEVHGSGAHLDSFETIDSRLLIPHTLFSIEPGIYLENKFGIRLETNVYLDEKAEPVVTAGLQKEFFII